MRRDGLPRHRGSPNETDSDTNQDQVMESEPRIPFRGGGIRERAMSFFVKVMKGPRHWTVVEHHDEERARAEARQLVTRGIQIVVWQREPDGRVTLLVAPSR